MHSQLARSPDINSNFKNQIIMAEQWMKEQPQIELKVIHHFSYGVYARELHIPKGVLLTGEIHKYENLNILSKGRLKVSVDNQIIEVVAPFTVVSPPGTKRIAFTLEDCIWTTIHGTFEKDINEIKNKFIAATEQEWLEFCGHNQLRLFN